MFIMCLIFNLYLSRPWRGRRTTRCPRLSRPREKSKQTIDWTEPVCFCCTVWGLFGPVVCWFWKHVGRRLCHCIILDICPVVIIITVINMTFCSSSSVSVSLGSSTWRGWSSGWTWMSRWCRSWGLSCPVWASRALTPFSPSYRRISCWQQELLQLYRCLSSCWEYE